MLSSAIAVVNVLVNPLMFPPSMSAIPISELTLEKAARITAKISYRISQITVHAALSSDAPNEKAVSLTRKSTVFIVV